MSHRNGAGAVGTPESAERLAAAISARDVGSVAGLLTADATIWRNTDGRVRDRSAAVAETAAFFGQVAEVRYEEMRVLPAPRGYVQQHVLVVRTTGAHEAVCVPACMVVETRDGLITRIEEYFDESALAGKATTPAGPLDGRVAVVTGVGRGIGRAIATSLAEAGASVVVNDLTADMVEETVGALHAAGLQAVGHAGDITHDKAPSDLVSCAVDQFGTIDIVVNNAGYSTYGAALEMTDEQWQPMFDLLLTAPFRLLRAAGRQLVRPASHVRKVVNVSSVGGIAGSPNAVGYAAAKAGIHGLTATLAKEWGPYGVTVNAVAPGLIRTRQTEGPAAGHESIEVSDGGTAPLTGVPLAELETQVPLRRIGVPEDVGGAVRLLCLPEADYVSGQVLVVGGGWMP
ncbi:SDR family oxidoreductase [Amycolatopsis circi]|uniref:SDR family oxidoreductase n=1 Tax=Amycolatopsis circi TaxID=871959 RepID=UPI0013BE98CA|nr:SDR family oxidoreductase [Amycolatopsis circi]